MAEWKDISLEIPGIEPMGRVQQAIATLIDIVEPVVSTVNTLLAGVAAAQDIEDAAATAINLALNALRGTLDDFLKASAGHMLFVPPIPPYRRPPARPVVPVRKLEDMVYGMRVLRGAADDLVGDGGNYGLYRKFVESLFDAGDYARPQYRSDAYIGGAILVFGSDSYATMLSDLLALADIFGNSLNISFDGYSLPVPQNVKARPIAVPAPDLTSDLSVISAASVGAARDPYGANVLPILSEPKTPPNFGVRVQWDSPRVISVNAGFGENVYRIKSWHVFIKPGSRMEPGEPLGNYEVYYQNLPGYGVATRALGITAGADIVGNVSGCIIRDLDPATTYYIGVAYTLEVEDLEADLGPTTLRPAYETLSGQVRVNLQEQAPYRKIMDGLPPDWMALTSPLAVFPSVQKVLAEAQAIADLVIANYAAYENELAGLLQLGNDVLQTVVDANAALESLLGNVRQLFSGLTAGIWGASFSGQGGVTFLIDAVGELLLDAGTTNRPPFDKGDEAVSAMVFVTGSDSAASVAAFIGVLNTVFGLSTSSATSVISSITRQSALAASTAPLDAGANPTTAAQAQNLTSAAAPSSAKSLGLGEDPCD